MKKHIYSLKFATVAVAFVYSFLFSAFTAYSQCNFTVSPNAAAYGCYSTLENVVWASTVNVTVSGTDLTKSSGGNAWNGGAFSTAAVYNNGYMETVVAETNSNRAIGLSNTNPDANISTILFAVYLRNNATLEVYESGSSRGNFGAYATGDTIRIRVERGQVKYYKNSTILYSSGVTPTLPLYVDASLNTTSSTLQKVVIGNLSNGVFKATATTPGTGPSYQWKLNGANVGTNSATYTNTGLTNNDVLTCVLTPGASGCSVSPVTSNNLTIKFRTVYNYGDFYVRATPATSGCAEAIAQVVWDSLSSNLSVSGNNLNKIQSNGNWNGGAASLNTVSNNGYLQFTATETDKLRAIGLSATNANSNYTSIQYAIYLSASGTFNIYESNNNRGTFGSYATNDVFKVAVESNVVKYYQNGNLVYISAVAPTLPMLVDVSINNTGGTVTNALVSNVSGGVFTAVATSAGPSPVYQWKLSGVNVGTNSPTYTNTGLSNNDVVSCTLTPNLNGCSALSYVSNTVTYKTTSPSSNMEFYITGTPASNACFTGEEQVRWKVSDLSNVLSNGNNLSKFQSGNNWNGGAASWNTVVNNGYFQFTATETNTTRAAGLSSANANSNYTSIDYAFYLTNSGTVQIYESGNNRGTFGSYISGDVFKILVDLNVVKYYQNGNLLYISTLSPTLPLMADVSIYSLAGTITNAAIGNYSSGTYTATASNPGPSPVYQWKVNGSNVGTNSATYTNTSLLPGDVVSCTLTSALPGCSVVPLSSNTIINKVVNTSSTIEFYINSIVASAACSSPEERIRWKASDMNFVVASGNTLTKLQSNGNWDGGAASWNTVANNGYLQFTATETNTARMIGLSSSNTNANFNTIQYAIYLMNNGSVKVYESGNDRGTFSTYATNDIFKILVDNGSIKYYQNGNLLYMSTVAPSLPLLVDVSINNAGGTIGNILISNYNQGFFQATAVNAGGSPSYQWKLNGVNVGTNSATYANTSLAVNDVITCVLTPALAGCGTSVTYTSNSITNKTMPSSAAFDVVVSGIVVPGACRTAEEQVKWETLSLANVQLTSVSSLSKFRSNNNWDGSATSYSTVDNNGYLQFTATETNTFRAVGLSAIDINSHFNTIQYAFYLTNVGTVQITESGSNRGTFGTYNSGDVFAVSVESSIVKYYQNGVLLYISNVAPTLPMQVDVSLYTIGATVTNPVVNNYNAGSFTVFATNAGPFPVYQWKLNGTNVGTNSTSYTNTSLAINDVVTCVVTPNVGGCSNVQYSSNSITNKALAFPSNVELYITGTAATSACNTTEEEVKWKLSSLANVVASGNDLNKIQSDGNWDGGAASWNTVSNNGYLQFAVNETSTSRMIGLSNANTNSDYTTIQYAIYLLNNGTAQVYESGNNRFTIGAYNNGDLFKILVDNSVVKYYQNGSLVYTSTAPPTLPLLVDVSIRTLGGTVLDAVVSNNSSGVFTASVSNAGGSPSYQWQLNGGNVGTNSSTYTNTTLNEGDVLTCLVSPSLTGCSGVQYASNSIINHAVTTPANMEFYIKGTVPASACNIAEEQVKWKAADLNFVTATGNNLQKVQSNGNWDGGAASWNTVSDNGYLQFTASETDESRMVGLSTTNTGTNYTSIQYAIYLVNTGSVRIYESGTDRGTFSTYTTNDVFKISVESGIVKYYQNNNLLYISSVTPTLPMLVDVSIRDIAGTVTNAVVGNYNTGSFTATAINAGGSPGFVWKVNGVNVGTGTTYTNASLNNNDVVTCVLTPSLPGCSSTQFVSNSIVNKPASTSSSIEFYIKGTAATSACLSAEEQVRWKVSDLTNVQAAGNSLSKVQSNGNWDGGAASWNTVSNNGYFQFIASETNTNRMAGLSASNPDANYNSIQYAFYLLNSGLLRIYESGNSQGTFGTYISGDTMKIKVEAGIVKYYRNSTLLYISSVAPSLPLLVDVSLNTVGSTVTNAVIGNYNTGVFTASATNAGVSPAYQWKLNGVNVGTNSTTYTNTSLSVNDVVTCVLTPSLSGCGASTYTSNSITAKLDPRPASMAFYITGIPATSACNAPEEQVRWKLSDLTNLDVSGSNLYKLQSNGNWDGGAASLQSVSDNGYFQFTVTETNTFRAAGLSTTNTNSHHNTIQYSFYLNNTGTLYIFESGTNRGTFGSYLANDLLKIAVEGGKVKYYQNGTLLYISTVTPTLPLIADVSINTNGGTITNPVIANYNGGTFTAVASNIGGSPVYQWKLNGANVGTNSATYTNASLNNNDVVTCTLTPGLAGCAAAAYVSNSITNKKISVPTSIDFYIAGTAVSTACRIVAEQVQWKTSDLSNVVASGNTLSKLQSNNNWDGGASSWNRVSNNGYLQFQVGETNTYKAVGLSTTNADAHYNSIQYAFYFTNTGILQITESGVNRGSFSSYSVSDTFKVAVESSVVKYYQNSTLLYVSSIAPSLPLLADVSIYSNGATLNNATVNNYNNGVFTATSVNAGVSPTYQWKLNGANVGTNSSTYTNASLSANDIVTCVLTPNLNGCSASTFVSNSALVIVPPSPSNVDVYINATVGASACNSIAEEQVKWKLSELSSNLVAVSNNLTKIQSNGNWDGGAASWNTVSNNGYLQFVAAETGTARMVGLSTANTDANFNTIQYAIYTMTGGSVQIYESGNGRGTFGTYASGDVFKIAVESNVVKYYKNEVLLYVSGVTPTLPLLVDVSINSTDGTVSNAVVGNYTTNTFTVGSANAGTPTYLWKLNGASTGVTASSYTNTGLASGDQVTCVVTSTAAGCGAQNYTTNTIVEKLAPVPSTLDFRIQGTVVASSCNYAEEQVKWKVSDLSSNMQATSNNLYKVSSNNSWNGGAASWNTVSNNGFMQFTVLETNRTRAIGLSTTNADANYTSIQYGVYLQNNATFQVMESGVSKGSFGTYSSSDVFKVAVESSVVKYYRNGTLFYTSAVAPTLPMLVDVSVYHTGGTFSNVLVFNYNSGSYTATAIGAGATPTYQWQVNGTNVATGSTYTNGSLAIGDAVTCILTPALGGCPVPTVVSNTITNRSTAAPAPVEFYITGTASASACSMGEEQVSWKNTDLVNVQASGSNLNKTRSNGNWDGGAASWNTVKNNGYLEFTATETNRSRMVGLSSSNASAHYNSIQYAFYMVSNSSVRIYESGADRGTFSSYSSGDVFRISVEGGKVKYYQNGGLLYISTVAPTLPLLVDVSIRDVGGTVTNPVIGNLNTGVFTAVASNAGVNPSYQWKLNGANVGTNSTAYTNTALVAGNVVTCVLTPDLGACGVGTYTSNAITEKAVTVPFSGIDFYIKGTVATSACNAAEEQVVWKTGELNYVQASGNNLSKIQSNGNWDGGAASLNAISNNGYFQFTATETDKSRMVGLSTTNTDNDFATIQYAFYLLSNGTLQIYESGNNRGGMGPYSSGDVFKITVEASVVKYYKNGVLLYISGVAPTLPMIADVSIYHKNGTVTDAVIGNYNTGVFSAVVANAGGSPTYQWKLNGGNVGTNSSTYTNTSLNNGDVITCVLSPALGGCTATAYTSNSITNRAISTPLAIDFYITGTVASSACNTAEEQVKWKISDLSNLETNGNSLTKLQSNSNWDGGAASWNTVSNNGYFEFTATETNRYRAVGLSTTNAGSDYNSIQYAFYLTSNGTVQVYESGNYRGSFGTYSANDVFRIAVEVGIVKYYKNGALQYISTVAPTLPMLVDVSIYNTGGTVTNAVIGNYNTGTFTATAVNAGGSPTYQWKLNGGNVGTNSSTYTNSSLNLNDVVSCVLTPAIGGCSSSLYTSNTITNKVVSNPTNIDFYITGTSASSACNTVDEQVKWKISDLSNLQATNNDLVKIQSNGNWDGGAASWNTVKNNGYFQFTATETNSARMVGLSAVNTDAHYNTIQYAFYLTSTSLVQIYESGTGRGTIGAYVTGDVFKIAVEAGVVKYYQNSNLVYTSSIAPSLPLLADVSINSVNGTVTNAIVSNYNTGQFSAVSTNAGGTPSYQWKLNGANVATGFTYTNTALTNSDVITCVLTPSIAGCSSATYTSNSLTNKSVSAPLSFDFYIYGQAASSACNTVDEQISWKVSSLNYVVATANSLQKVQSNGNWDGGAASWNSVANNGYFQFSTQESNTSKVVGLSTVDGGTNNSSIQYGFFLTNGSAMNIVESGTNRGSFGNYSSGDLFKIAVESNVVKYYKNGTLIYISAVSPVLPLIADVSIAHVGGTVSNAIISNYSTGTFAASVVNAGPAPVYQWKLNGSNILGANSSTYVGSSLGNGDVVSCVVTPNIGGCSSSNYLSNLVTNQVINDPQGVEFRIVSVAAASAYCSAAEEQVRWKTSDYQNVQGNGNNLVKVQSNGTWNGGAASWNVVYNNGYMQFTATETNKSRMVGLSTTNANSSNTSIQYAFSLTSSGIFSIVESGVTRLVFGAYATNDVFRIAVQNNVVKYYRNGTFLYSSAITPTLPLLVDVSIANLGGTVTNAIVANLSAGSFTASAANVGSNPTYRWKLNGVDVGTNSPNYSNPSLTSNDVISCALTPDLQGCSGSSYISNTIVYRVTTITTQPSSQSICIGGSATLNVVATGGTLSYQWRRNGVNLPGAAALTSSYTISAATAASAGNYDVIVNTGGCTSNVAVVSVTNLNQWSGTISSAWTTDGNWSCGIVPTAASDAIIPSVAPNMPVVSTSVNLNNLVINTSGTLTNTGGTLNVYGNINNNGTYTDNGTTVFTGSSAQSITGATNFNNLTLNNPAGLTLNNASTVRGVLTLASGAFTTNDNLSVDLYWGSIAGTGSGSTSGNIRFFKTIWGSKYHYISSPIPGRTAADWNDDVTIKFGANANMYYYDETIPDTTVKVGWLPVASIAQPLQTMIGYALYFRNYNTEIDVTGPYTHSSGTYTSPTLTNTKSTIPTFKPASDGWNHLGNPYPTTLDWDAPSGWTKTGIDNAVYYWDPANNRFAAYVAGVGTNGGSRYIPSMQGFFVKVTTSGGTGSVSMNRNVRTTAMNVDVWRTADEEQDLLRLSVSADGAIPDETVIRMVDTATTSFDSNCDAYKMMNEGQTPSFFSTYNGNNYAINSLPSGEGSQIIPLTLDAKFAGKYTFTADLTGFEKVDSLVLVDQETGVRQNLKTNPTYACDLPQGVIGSRFYINYKKEAVVTDNGGQVVINPIRVYSYEQKVTVDFNASSVKEASILIYDLKGHVVYKIKNQPVSGKLNIDLPYVSSGIYVVKVESSQASMSQEVYLAK